MIYQHEIEERRPAPRRKILNLPKEDRSLRRQFERYLEARELDPALAVANGWYPSSKAGDREPRIVIPCSPAHYGFWQARYMGKKPGVKRYMSPHAERRESIVLVWPRRRHKGAVVLEGPTCALAAAMEGYLGVALLGNTPPGAAIEYVANLVPEWDTILVLPDLDALSLGPELVAALTVRKRRALFVTTSPYKDFSDAPLSKRRRILERAG